MINLLFKRPDGTFVADVYGQPYHVIPGDEPLWTEANERAAEMGDDLGFDPPPQAIVIPPVKIISDRQFAQGLAVAGLITEAEAEDWVGPGTVPDVLLNLINSLPEEVRFAARMLLRGATQFERSHPLTEILGGAYGWSPEETDDFWRACAAL